jgi:hypothetical protein
MDTMCNNVDEMGRIKYTRLSAVGLWLCLLLCAVFLGGVGRLASALRLPRRPLAWNGSATFDCGAICAVTLVWGLVELCAFAAGGLLAPAGSRPEIRVWIRSWNLPWADLDSQKALRFADTAIEALVLVGAAAAVRFCLFLGVKLGIPALEGLELVRVGALTLIAVSVFVISLYLLERLFKPERSDRIRRCIANCLGLSGWMVPLVLVLVTQGAVVAWLCTAMIRGGRAALIARPAHWGWGRRISSACALLLCGVSFLQQPGGGGQALAWARAGFPIMPGGAGYQGHRWAVIAIAGLLTSLGHLSGFRQPLMRWGRPRGIFRPENGAKPEQSIQIDPRKRLLEIVLWIQGAAFGAVALYGAARWPNNAVWYILLALLGALPLRYTDGGSFAVIVFVMIPRWTMWLLMIRQAPLTWIVLCLCCEILFLMPSLWPAVEPEGPSGARNQTGGPPPVSGFLRLPTR